VKQVLLVFYSRTGTTRVLAERIAGLCPCDVEEIRDVHERGGFFGALRSAWDGWTRRSATIQEPRLEALNYDLVVVGTPVWVGSLAAPTRRYLVDNRSRFNRVAFFCTLGGSAGGKALQEMGRVVGKTPIATLSVTQREVESNRYRDKAREFANEINRAMNKGPVKARLASSGTGRTAAGEGDRGHGVLH
jgi:flavodoxin